MVYGTGVFADVEMEPAKMLFKDNLHWIAQRHVHMPFSQMAKMTFQRVRDMFG